MGSRFGGLKQLHGFGRGEHAILEYSVYDALRAGFGRVVIVIRREFEQSFRERLSDRFSDRIEVELVFQEMDDVPGRGRELAAGRQKPWGTAHAVYAARGVIEGPFAVINADDYYGPGALRAAAQWLRDKTAADPSALCLVAYRLEHTLSGHGTVSRGICRSDAAGNLVSVVERRRLRADGADVLDEESGERFGASTPVSMNLFGLSAAWFGELQSGLERFVSERGADPKAEYYLPEYVGGLVDAGKARVRLIPTDEHWMGMTYREDEPEVAQRLAELVRAGVYPEVLW